MPGKLLSDVDLDSDTAMEKVETPRKQNAKVPPRAEGPRALRGAGYRMRGCPAKEPVAPTRTRRARSLAWGSAGARRGASGVRERPRWTELG